MPGLDGISAAEQLRDAVPDCKVVIVTTFGRPGYLRRALEAGARAFLVKDGPVEDLAKAIRRVVAGEQVVDPSLAVAALREGPNPLSEREIEVAAGRAGWRHGLGYCRPAVPVGEHRAQLSVRHDRQDRDP